MEPRRPSEIRSCKLCGKPFKAQQYMIDRGGGLYCSNICKNKRDTPENRWWSFVQKTETCWLWTGYTANSGYGHISVNSLFVKAHRFGYELLVGSIPSGYDIDHLCRNKACVNPEHLEAVPHRVNVLRGEGLAAREARQTHCKRGHLLGGENVSPSTKKRGLRICRECNRIRSRERYLARKAATRSL